MNWRDRPPRVARRIRERLRLQGLIGRIPRTHRHSLTGERKSGKILGAIELSDTRFHYRQLILDWIGHLGK